MRQSLIKGIIHWSLFAVAFIFFLSGFGITEYRIVEPLTFGLLNKVMSFQIHLNLWIPFLILFIVHSFFGSIVKIYKKIRTL